MKRFKTTVTRIDEYIVEFDENIINEEWMANFRRYFYNFYDLEEHAEHLAQFRAKFGDHSFIEGYGVPLINGENPLWDNDETSLEEAINIKVISEDQDCEVEVEEI